MTSSTLPDDDLYPLIEARHADPFRILGLRDSGKGWIARVWRPDVDAVTLREAGPGKRRFVLEKIHQEGLFESVLPGVDAPFSYDLELRSAAGAIPTRRR